MANEPPPTARGGLALYANLLDPTRSSAGTISSAPVSYNTTAENGVENDEAAKKQQALAGIHSNSSS